MSIDLSMGDLGSTSFDMMVDDLKKIYDKGVRNIVDLTNQSMGRNADYVKRLMDATGINIIMSTGYYLEQYIEKYIKDYSANEIAKRSIDDIEIGICDNGKLSDIKAGVIGEIAWRGPGAGEMEKKAWEAMCIVANKTGAVVSTHPSKGVQQNPQAEYLIENGISPEKIVIGHIEFYPSEEKLKELLDMGVYIGVDMVGKKSGKSDDYRADIVKLVKDWGYLSKLTLSLDLCRKEDLKSCNGYGYIYLFDTFIPMLKDRGITDEEIELLLKDNPKRLFR